VPEAASEAPVALSAEPATGDHVFDLRDDSVELPAGPVPLDPRYALALRLSAVESAATPVAEGEGRPATAIAEPAEAIPGEPAPASEHAAETAAATAATLPPAPPASTHRPPPEPEPPAPVRRTSLASKPPLWLRVQREAAESAPARSFDEPDRRLADGPAAAPVLSPSRQAADAPAAPPANPWPPLGASWPSHEQPGAPWPGPDATALPAVVAARQGSTPTMAEMWVQSSQEVLNRGSVRVCRECTLPISTKARFCRRCGTQQA